MIPPDISLITYEAALRAMILGYDGGRGDRRRRDIWRPVDGAADRAGTALLFLAERAGEIEMANGLRVVAQHGTGA